MEFNDQKLSRNLVMQSRENHFREYINKWQLFSNTWDKRKWLELIIHHSNTKGGDKNFL